MTERNCDVVWCRNTATVKAVHLRNGVIHLCVSHRESLGACPK